MERRLRLRDGADFRSVRQGGRRYGGRLMRVHVARGRRTHNRYGLVTGRHVGGAVQRNRSRRLLREALRALHPGLLQGHDLVIVANTALAKETVSGVNRELQGLLRKAGLIGGGDSGA